MKEIEASLFTWSNSARCLQVGCPLTPSDSTEKWILNSEWEIVGYTNSPPLQPNMETDKYIGVMFENKMYFEKVWFHWPKNYRRALPEAPDGVNLDREWEFD
jgi:hypothetical protein